MTVIRPNSITGITSITALNDTISVYKSDGTTAGLQLDGVNFNTTGVSTIGQLNVGTGGTVITTTASGNVGIGTEIPGAKLHVSGGNVKVDSGYGIDFSATANSSGTMSSELLDDYEEGTWSPGITSSSLGNGIFSYTVTYAKYTKVGRLVNIAARITGISWTGSPSGYMQITGAPFTKTSDHFPVSAVSMYYITFGADSYNTLEFITASSTTTMYVRTTINGAVGTDLQIGSVNNGNGGLVMSMTYYV